MADTVSYQELLYEYELLRARLGIREHYVKTIVQEIYDNIGQVLSLVRVQLAMLNPGGKADEKAMLDSSGQLVGAAIRDLRSMCRQFQPEEAITGWADFNDAFSAAVKSTFPGAAYRVQQTDPPAIMAKSRIMILLNLLLDMMDMLRENETRKLVAADMSCLQEEIVCCMQYTGELVTVTRFKNKAGQRGRSVAE
ncbi:MAG: histidine kinase dimerization/phosphoacceptor domain-containing protein, partial [Chitinophagaceae bacterium]